MIHKTRYQSRTRRHKPRADDEEFYWPGDRVTIEVWDHLEGEEEEETGLLDANGNPIIRIVRFVSPPIGFIWPKDEDE